MTVTRTERLISVMKTSCWQSVPTATLKFATPTFFSGTPEKKTSVLAHIKQYLVC